MSNKTTEQELLDLEKQYWQAIKDKDIEAAMRLTDETCFVAGAQGAGRIDKKTMAAMMAAAPFTVHNFEFRGEPLVRFVREDVAIVAYRIREELTVEGKPVTLDAADASTWVKRDGRWLCVLHTESIAGDPFGRDRRSSE
jgi:hypothetical protein